MISFRISSQLLIKLPSVTRYLHMKVWTIETASYEKPILNFVMLRTTVTKIGRHYIMYYRIIHDNRRDGEFHCECKVVSQIRSDSYIVYESTITSILTYKNSRTILCINIRGNCNQLPSTRDFYADAWIMDNAKFSFSLDTVAWSRNKHGVDKYHFAENIKAVVDETHIALGLGQHWFR